MDKLSTNFINRGSKSPITMLDGRDENFPMLVTHQSMKKACTSVTGIKEITLEFLSKKCFLGRLEVEKIQL